MSERIWEVYIPFLSASASRDLRSEILTLELLLTAN